LTKKKGRGKNGKGEKELKVTGVPPQVGHWRERGKNWGRRDRRFFAAARFWGEETLGKVGRYCPKPHRWGHLGAPKRGKK